MKYLILTILLGTFFFLQNCLHTGTRPFPYQDWMLEKTLLISGRDCRPLHKEHFDIYLAVDKDWAQRLEACVRLVTKLDWNKVETDIPCQVYNIRQHAKYTTFRVAFNLALQRCSKQRMGILYHNPKAKTKQYPSNLSISGTGKGYTVENPFYRIKTHEKSGQITSITYRGPKGKEITLHGAQAVQKCVQVVLAKRDGDKVSPVAISADDLKDITVETEKGPVFFSLILKGRLASPFINESAKSPALEIHYRFFADLPYFLVYTKLVFPEQTEVFAVQDNMMILDNTSFTHYIFRPVTPTLPDTDIEEMGYVMIDTAYTREVPEGLLLAGMLPPDLAWQGYINIDNKHTIVSINFLDSAYCPSGPAAAYRSASYAAMENNLVKWFNAPVYVGKRDRKENIIRIGKGSVYIQSNVILFADWDREQFPKYVESLGKQLNNAPDVKVYPKILPGPVPEPEFYALPMGRRAHAYLKAGVR